MTQLNEANFQEELQGSLTDDPDFLRDILRAALQEFLESEFSAFIGAAPSQRIESRVGYRCGHYQRGLITRVGTLDLNVPRDRDGVFSTQLFDRYQRNEKALVLAIMESYVQGVSTRRIKKITEALCGVSFSKSQVSELAKGLDEALAIWRNRPLQAHYSVLYVDGMYSKVREERRVVKQYALVVLGICPDGTREVLGTSIVHEENEAEYHDLFRDLKRRGVRKVDLIVSDAHIGLKAAIVRGFPGSAWQRCLFHFIRNLIQKFPKRHQQDIRMRVLLALQQHDQVSGEKAILDIAVDVARYSSDLADWLEQAAAEITAHMEFPRKLWKCIRSNNLLERFNKELRRRERVVGIFPNQASALRLISALAAEKDDEWRSARRYLDPELLQKIQMRKAS